jgi:hypothetical protein
MYRLAPLGVIRLSDGVNITPTMREDWAVYREWTNAGNVPAALQVDILPLADRRIEYAARVNAKRNDVLDGGFNAGGHLWDSNRAARLNFTEAIAAYQSGEPFPSDFTWRDATNVDVAMTRTQFIALIGALRRFVDACQKRTAALKAQILSSDTPESVDVSSGWPS